jgi:hypothetical protein
MHELIFGLLFLFGTFSVLAIQQPTSNAEPTNADEAAAAKIAAEAETDAKYQVWVATLTPQQQAWEIVLQENLGDFYLPLHKGNKVGGKSNA